MHADLMGAAGPDPHFEKAELRPCLGNPVLGKCGPAGTQAGGHPGTTHGIACDRRGNAPVRLLHSTVHQSEIYLLNLPIVKLSSKGLMRPVSPGNDENSTRITIQPMHNPGTQITVNRG
jgi:hypothetical protein